MVDDAAGVARRDHTASRSEPRIGGLFDKTSLLALVCVRGGER